MPSATHRSTAPVGAGEHAGMAGRVSHTTVDSHGAFFQARWWATLPKKRLSLA